MSRRWQPLKLTSRHKEIMRRTLLGQSQVDIAKELGMTQVGVNQIVNSDKFQRNLHALQGTVEQMLVEGIVDRELNDPVRQKLDEYKLDAVNEMFSLMKHAESETVRRASAADILDRAGYKPREVVETQHNFNIAGDTEDNINQALKDLGIGSESKAPPRLETDSSLDSDPSGWGPNSNDDWGDSDESDIPE